MSNGISRLTSRPSASNLSPVPPNATPKHRAYLLAQLWRGDDFGVFAATPHLPQQFAGVGVGDDQFQGAVGEKALALRRAADFVGNPAGGGPDKARLR